MLVISDYSDRHNRFWQMLVRTWIKYVKSRKKKDTANAAKKLNGTTPIRQAEINSMNSPKPTGLYEKKKIISIYIYIYRYPFFLVQIGNEK